MLNFKIQSFQSTVTERKFGQENVAAAYLEVSESGNILISVTEFADEAGFHLRR